MDRDRIGPYDRIVRCPSCKQRVLADRRDFAPFCSRRCKLLDLGRWLDGRYAIPGEPASDEELSADVRDDQESKPQRR